MPLILLLKVKKLTLSNLLKVNSPREVVELGLELGESESRSHTVNHWKGYSSA